LCRLAKNTKKVSFSASNRGVFPYATYAVFLGVTYTEALRKLHANLNHQREAWASEFTYFYEPDILVPHITLACRLTEGEAKRAASSAYSLDLPVNGELCKLALVNVETKEVLFSFSLC
jgi:2'-5' RNA ligase